ncbi:hypothetical protein LCGC14_2345410, partial [marine sediment metagenome]
FIKDNISFCKENNIPLAKSNYMRIKYITDSDESSKVAMIWAQVYTDKIIQKSEHLSLSPTEISLFKNVRETFQSILSPASKNDAMKNYKEAGNAFDSLLYKIQEQMPGEQLRIWNKNAADKAKIREMMQREKRSSPAVGMDGEKHVERVEDVSGDEEISERESDEVKPEFQASKLKLSPNKCSKLTKVICSVSVVVAAILMMLYKYNE